MDMKLTKEILNYIVTAELKEIHVDFEIFEEDGDKEPMFIGHVKWDGCSNWHIPNGNYQFHFCSIEQAKNLGVLLGELYEWANELMPEQEVI